MIPDGVDIDCSIPLPEDDAYHRCCSYSVLEHMNGLMWVVQPHKHTQREYTNIDH